MCLCMGTPIQISLDSKIKHDSWLLKLKEIINLSNPLGTDHKSVSLAWLFI